MKNRDLLEKFQFTLNYFGRTKRATFGKSVLFKANKQEVDGFLLKRVLDNCLYIKEPSKEVNEKLDSLAEYIIENIASKGEGYYYIHKHKIDLSDDDIITLSKYNKFFSKEREFEKQNQDSMDR